MERKEEIILAALELASENGLQSVSMNQIAEKIRIKAPSLYNHFKSKDEIVRAMYSYLREQAQHNRSFGFADPDVFASKRDLSETISLQNLKLSSECTGNSSEVLRTPISSERQYNHTSDLLLSFPTLSSPMPEAITAGVLLSEETTSQ